MRVNIGTSVSCGDACRRGPAGELVITAVSDGRGMLRVGQVERADPVIWMSAHLLGLIHSRPGDVDPDFGPSVRCAGPETCPAGDIVDIRGADGTRALYQVTATACGLHKTWELRFPD